MTAGIPVTKSARQRKITDLLAKHAVRSQTELAELLAAAGVVATQATLSRDLVELDAVKIRTQDGTLVYAVPAEGGDRTPRTARESPASGARLTRLAGELASADWDPGAGFAGYERRMRSYVEANQEIGRMHVQSISGSEPSPEPDMEALMALIERAVGGPELPEYDYVDALPRF